MPRSGVAGSYGNSLFSFLRNLHTVFQSATPIYISTNSIRRFHFLHTLSRASYLQTFKKMFLTEVWLIYGVVLISAVQQSNSVIHIYTFFFIFFFHYGLSRDWIRTLLFIHLKYNSLHLPIPNSQSILTHSPHQQPQVSALCL